MFTDGHRDGRTDEWMDGRINGQMRTDKHLAHRYIPEPLGRGIKSN